MLEHISMHTTYHPSHIYTIYAYLDCVIGQVVSDLADPGLVSYHIQLFTT